MPNACPPRLNRWSPSHALATLLIAVAALSGTRSTLAQTTTPAPNVVDFAKKVEGAMEMDGIVRLVVIRSSGLRGKFSVDVGIKSDSNQVVAATFKGTNIVFNDYQLSAHLNIPIADNTLTNSNKFSIVKLELKNPLLANGVIDPALTPRLGSSSEMELDVYDDDDPYTISFVRVNNWANEGTTAAIQNTNIVFTVKLGALPADPMDLGNISVDYTVRAAGPTEIAAGAEAATLRDAPATAEDDRDLPESFIGDQGIATGTLTFDGSGQATVTVPIENDKRVEFDEEFVISLGNPRGDTANPASTNMPPDRVRYALNRQAFARGRILFNTNYFNHPMPAGSVDQTFNPDNVVPLQLRRPGANGPVTAVAVDFFKTNYYVAGNFSAVNAITRHGLARLNSTGSVDQAFVPAQNLNGAVSAVDVYLNGPHLGEVVLGGGFTSVNGESRNSVARYLSNGALDPNFQIGLGANGPIYAVKVEGDNSTIIAGDFTTFDGTPRGRIARLLPSGKLDATTFNGTGANGPIYDLSLEIPQPFRFQNSQTNNTNSFLRNVPVPSRVGTIEVTYNNFDFTNHWRMTFGSTVILDTNLTNPFIVIRDPNDPNITTTNYTPVTIRLDLPRQNQVNNSLKVEIIPVPNNETNFAAWTLSALVRPMGTTSIAAVGDFTEFDEVPVNRIVKTDDLGAVDDVFASNIGTGASGTVQAIDIQTNGWYVIGGTFNSFNSQAVGNIAHISPSGVFDQQFSAGRGANGAIRDIFIEKSDRTDDQSRWNKIYIGGDFTEFNGSRRIFLARLEPEGYLDTSFMDSAFNQFAGFPSVSGLAPDGSIAAITVGRNPNPLVGGIFDLVGGGTNRAGVKPRQNFARLVGGETPGPGNFSFDELIFGGDEDGEFLIANLNLTNQATITPVALGSVFISTVDQSAIAGQDYLAIQVLGTNIVPGVSNYFLSVPIIDEQPPVIEGDEEFLITLPFITGRYSLGGEIILPEMAFGRIATATGRIVENDVLPAVFSFSKPEYNVDENRTTATIEIFRTGNASDRVTVQVSALSSTNSNKASTPADFTAITNQIVVFPSGVTNLTITVPIRDDQIVEVDETIALQLSGASTGSIVDTNLSNAILNIIDNDLPAGKIDFTFGGFTVVEGQTHAILTLTRSGGNVGFIALDYQTSDGTALRNDDYVFTSGHLTWNDRDISERTILIPIVDDGLVETSETFTVTLSNPSQPGIIGTRHPVGTVTINDNDFFGSLQFGSTQYFADENGVNAIIQVVRRNGSADTVSVTYNTAPGTAPAAVPGKDYNNVTGVLTFGPGETAKTFVVPVLDDSDPDGPRNVRLTLSAPVRATLGTNSAATLTIVDNELENVPAGGVDTDFVTVDGANGPVNVVAIYSQATDATRKILIAGEFTLYDHINRQRVARLNNDGTLDRNYAINTLINGSVRAALVQPDGSVIIGGHFTQVDDATIKHIARLNTAGHYDSSFRPGAGPDNAVYALAAAFAGNPTNNLPRILVGGDFVTYDSLPRQRIAMIRPDGTLDPNFDAGIGPNSSVFAIAVQRDQKILIGGEFVSVEGIPRAHIARLNPDGSVDTTFDPGTGFDGAVRSIVVQADDRILVGGDFNKFDDVVRPRIARLQIDGQNDPSFDPGSGADATVNSIALQSDGKIVVGGDFALFNGAARRSLVRLLPAGAVDLSINFGSGPNGVVNSVAIQSDRGILIGGDFTAVDGVPRNRVARVFGGSFFGSGAVEFAAPVYTVNEGIDRVAIQVRRTGGLEGQLTATYETTGITATPAEDYVETTNTVTFQPGEVFRTILIEIKDDVLPEPNEYVGVTLRDPVGGAIGRQPVTTIEILSDDTRISFPTDFFVINENAPGSRANITIIREGISTQPVTVILSTADGTATANSDYTAVSTAVTFGPDETTKVVSIPLLDDTIVEGDETVQLKLTLVTQAPDINLGRATATLTIADNDVAPGTLEFSGPAIVDEDAGTVSITVTRSAGRLGAVSVTYTTEDGTAKSPSDYTASTGTVNFQQTDTARTIVIPIRDDLEVEGNENFRVRLSNPTGGAVLGPQSVQTVVIVDDDFGPGSLDQSFDIGSGAAGTVFAMVLQPDGKIVAGGNFTDFDNSGHPRLVRLTTNGPVDANFFSGSGPAGTVYALGLGEAGRIVLGGDFRSLNSFDRPYFARVTAGGAIDPSMTVSPGLNALVRGLSVQPDANVVIGGAFTSPASRAGRVLVSGAFDVSFNVQSGANANILDAQVQGDKVLFGGLFTQFGGLPRGGVVRVLSNGLVDPTFNTSVGANGAVNRVWPMAGGKVLVAGNFTTFNGVKAVRVALLNNDGSVDTNFSAGDGPDAAVFAVAIQKDGKILIGGDFLNVNNQARSRIARLEANGSLDATFKPGLGPNNTVYDIDIQTDGKILIAGSFTEVNGFPRRGIARINDKEPVKDIAITSTVIAGSDLRLTFASETGATYALEATTDLTSPTSWVTVDSVTASGSSSQFTVPIEAGYRFFRIKRL